MASSQLISAVGVLWHSSHTSLRGGHLCQSTKKNHNSTTVIAGTSQALEITRS